MRDVLILALILTVMFFSVTSWFKNESAKMLAHQTDQWTDIKVKPAPNLQKQEVVEENFPFSNASSRVFEPPKLADRVEYTKEELEALEWLVMEEHGGHSYEGQLYTASVIVNRVLHDDFPDNLHDVIYQKEPVWQFTPVARGLLGRQEPTKSVKKAVKLALQRDYVDGAWMFNVKSMTASDTQKWFEQFEIVKTVDGTQYRK
jgi:spore germination cell wall hydrolase CwlJ-like protein